MPLVSVKLQNFQGLSLQMEEEVDIILAGQPNTPWSEKVQHLLNQQWQHQETHMGMPPGVTLSSFSGHTNYRCSGNGSSSSG